MKAGPSRRDLYGWYVVAVLAVAYVFSFLDRQILALLVEPLKKDLSLTDTQVSLLQGLAFAICNGIGGLPIGRWVDVGRRVTIVSAGVAFWSVMTALCGLASRFWTLFLFRMGVGVGEASLTPAAYSIIADSVRPARLGLALGVFTIGVHIGSGIALLLGASLIQYATHAEPVVLPLLGTLRPWQTVFLAVGLPGLAVALWTLTLREPERTNLRDAAGASLEKPSLREVLAYFRANGRVLRSLYLCMAFAAMASYALNAWMVSLLIRTFDWNVQSAGHSFGLVVIVFGVLGVLTGGAAGDAVTARRVSGGRLLVMACAALAAMPFALFAPLASEPSRVLVLIAPMVFFNTLIIGLGPSALQELVPNRMRGISTSVGVLVVNLLGLGLGPTAIALVTDYGFADEQRLRHSMALLLPLMLGISAVLGFRGLKHFQRHNDDVALPDPARAGAGALGSAARPGAR